MQTLGVVQAVRAFGHEPVVLDWRPPKAVKYYRRFLYMSKTAPQNILKARRMRSFVSRHLPLSPRVYSVNELAPLCEKLDLGAVIVGSDQVWQLTPKSIRGWAPEFLLHFLPVDVKRIAYAPSAGSMTDFGSHADEAAMMLRQFDALSARDQNTVTLVKQATGRDDVAYVLDPTLLSEFSHAAEPPPINDPYLLVYAELPTRHLSFVNAIAQQLGLRVVTIGYRYAGASLSDIAVSPQRWLGYLANASFVITSFFHGTIFSIINRKPFFTMRQGHRSIKVMDLLDRFGLEDRALDIEQTHRVPSAEELALDYNAAEQRIEASRAESLRYLERALDDSP